MTSKSNVHSTEIPMEILERPHEPCPFCDVEPPPRVRRKKPSKFVIFMRKVGKILHYHLDFLCPLMLAINMSIFTLTVVFCVLYAYIEYQKWNLNVHLLCILTSRHNIITVDVRWIQAFFWVGIDDERDYTAFLAPIAAFSFTVLGKQINSDGMWQQNFIPMNLSCIHYMSMCLVNTSQVYLG